MDVMGRPSRLAWGLWVLMVLLNVPVVVLNLENLTWPLALGLIGMFS